MSRVRVRAAAGRRPAAGHWNPVRLQGLPVDWIRRCTRRVMAGGHVPDVDQLEGFEPLRRELNLPDLLERVDPRAMVRAVRQAHVQAFWFYAKCHYGNAYYPSRVGHVHTALKGRDLFGELCDACLSEGIVPLAVYEFSDFRMPKDHPDWCHAIPAAPGAGKTDITDAGQGARVGGPCLNGPYGDFVIEQVREVLSRYPVRGFYIDFLGLFGFEHWRCPYCGPKLKAVLGREFPGVAALSHAEHVRYQQWRWAQNDAYARRVRRVIKTLRPDVAFVHNLHAFHVPGNLQEFDFAARNGDFLTADLFHLRYGMLPESWKLRVLAAGRRDRPAEALLDSATAFQWDFRTPKALDSYRAELWTARALNVAACASFMFNLDGSVDRPILALIERVLGEQRVYEPWLDRMEPLAEVGLVRSGRTLACRPPETAGTYASVQHHLFDMEGWAQALIAGHWLWDMLDESQIETASLRRFRVLILPNVSCLGRRAAAAIQAFVRRGGALIATGDTSLFDEAGRRRRDFLLASVFGAQCMGDRRPDWNDLILDDPDLVPREPWVSPVLRLSDGQLAVRAAPGTDRLARVGRQLDPTLLTLQTFPTDAPGLLRRRLGRGVAWYFAGKPGLQYRIYGQHNMKRLLMQVLRQAAGARVPVRLEGPESIELFAHRQKGRQRLVVNLVHTLPGVCRSAGAFIAPDGKIRPGRFEEIESMPRVHAATLCVPMAGRRRPPCVTRAPSGRALPGRMAGGEYRVRLTNLGVHTMVVIE